MTSTCFEAGFLVWTEGAKALDRRHPEAVEIALRRHLRGDWGDLTDHDQRRNDEAAANGGQIVSAYDIHGDRLLIITEADRSATTLLTPGEY